MEKDPLSRMDERALLRSVGLLAAGLSVPSKRAAGDKSVCHELNFSH